MTDLKTPGDRALFALSHASLPTLAALFDDLVAAHRASSDKIAIYHALAEVHRLGCSTFGRAEFMAAVRARPEVLGQRSLDGRNAKEADDLSEDALIETRDALLLLFDENQVERLRVPFIVKELSKRLRLPQREIKRRLVALREYDLETFYYEGASRGVLMTSPQVTIRHYIMVDGVYRTAIIKLI